VTPIPLGSEMCPGLHHVGDLDSGCGRTGFSDDPHDGAGLDTQALGVGAADAHFTGLLLRQRICHVAHAQSRHQRAAVHPAEVITLAAAAVTKDLVPAVAVLDRSEIRGDLIKSDVPVNGLVIWGSPAWLDIVTPARPD